jgi:hypothetical protein
MNYKKVFPIVCSLVVPLMVQAQQRNSRDTIIPGQTIEIIQSYKPEIAKPVKPEWTPTLPKVDTTKPRFQYEVPQQTLSYTYHSVPIRPLAIGREEQVLPFQNYIKAGFGNLSSIYLDGGVATHQPGLYEGALHIHHLSQKGGIAHRQSSRSELDAQGKYYLGDHALGASVNLFRRGNTFYGYDHEQYTFSKGMIQQAFLGAGVELSAENMVPNDWNIDYKPTIGFGAFSDKYNANEKSFYFDIPARWQMDSTVSFMLGLKGSLVQFKNDSASTSNNYLQINPAVHFAFPAAIVHIGISPTFAKNNKTYFLPDIYAKYIGLNNRLALTAGWKGMLIQNTYQQLATKNPFIHNILPVVQSKTDQVFAGLEAAVGNHLSFNGTVSWRQWRNMPLFVNDYALSADGRLFKTVYDSQVQALSLDAGIRYQIGKTFELGASGTWYNFIKKTDKVWAEPMVRIGGLFKWQPLDKLQLQATADFWDGMYALDEKATAIAMPAFLDLSVGGEYNIVPRLSIFLQMNNILGTQYERWYQYPAYGFNIIGGLRFKF